MTDLKTKITAVVARGRYSNGIRFLIVFDTREAAYRWAAEKQATISTVEDALGWHSKRNGSLERQVNSPKNSTRRNKLLTAQAN